MYTVTEDIILSVCEVMNLCILFVTNRILLQIVIQSFTTFMSLNLRCMTTAQMFLCVSNIFIIV